MENAVERTANEDFATGEFDLGVIASRKDEALIDTAQIDRLLESLMPIVASSVRHLTTLASGFDLSEGTTKNESSRETTINSTTIKVTLSLTVDRKVPEFMLAIAVNEILDRLTGHMIMTLSSTEIDQVIKGVLDVVTQYAMNLFAATMPSLLSSFDFGAASGDEGETGEADKA